MEQLGDDALKTQSLLVDVLLPGGVSRMMSGEVADVLYLSHHRARAASELDMPVGASQPNDVGNCPVFTGGIPYDLAFCRPFECEQQQALQQSTAHHRAGIIETALVGSVDLDHQGFQVWPGIFEQSGRNDVRVDLGCVGGNRKKEVGV